MERNLLELFRPHHGEEKNILYAFGPGHKHCKPVYAYADTAGGRHAVLKGADKIIVYVHGFVVSLALEGGLFLEALKLVYGIVEL